MAFDSLNRAGMSMRRLKWFFLLVWQPAPEWRITIREAWKLAGILA